MPDHPTAPNHRRTALQEAIEASTQLSASMAASGAVLSEATELASQLQLSLRSPTSASLPPPSPSPSPPPSTPESSASTQPSPMHCHLTCPIHLEPIAENEAFFLPCGHVFCRECILRWLRVGYGCPVCRHKVYDYDHGDDDDADDHRSCVKHDDDDDDDDSASISSTSTQASDVTPAERELVEQVAFHHRLIAELELLVARAEGLILDDIEVELNTRWVDFLRVEIGKHEDAVEVLENELLDTTEYW